MGQTSPDTGKNRPADHRHADDQEDSSPAKLVEVVRNATRLFVDVNAATQAEYTLLFGCVSGPDHGAMGVQTAEGTFKVIDSSRAGAAIPILLGIYGMLALALLRLGITPGIVSAPIDLETNPCYAPYVLETIALIVCIAAVAFRWALGPRKIAGETV